MKELTGEEMRTRWVHMLDEIDAWCRANGVHYSCIRTSVTVLS